MSLRPHSHARVSRRAPETWGKCDRCNSIFLLRELCYQREWAGATLINKRLRVCSRCMDVPQEQFRATLLGPDPVPAKDPRPINNLAVMGGYAVMQRSAVVTGTAAPSPIYPGNNIALFNGYLSDSGADAGSDATGVLQSVYVNAGELGGDASVDAGTDAVVYSAPVQNVAQELMLQVIASDGNFDTIAPMPTSEPPNIPISIDPPDED